MLFALQIALTDGLIGMTLALCIFGGGMAGIIFSYQMVKRGHFKWTKDESPAEIEDRLRKKINDEEAEETP